ncbi:MAG: tetratricopeptide repeat protein [Dehalococcoidales bacterium]|nr:tetratricopeptide repeat protein [Dehalococcoidales bacterium]
MFFKKKKCPNCGDTNPKGVPTCARCGMPLEVRPAKILEAVEEYDEAIHLNPKSAEAYYKRGFFYQSHDYVEQAIEDFDQAIRLDPEFAKAYGNRAYAYLNKKWYDLAIADGTRAIALDPNDAVAYLNRGVAYRLQGDKAKAIADFEKSMALSDNPQLIRKAKQQIRELSK